MNIIKKSMAAALSLVMFFSALPCYADGETPEYSDYVPGEMPENLITSTNVFNNNGGNGEYKFETDGIKYVATDKTQNNPWNVFAPNAISAKNSAGNGTAAELDYYKAGTTYVYTAKVKNVSEDPTLTPYYGIAFSTKNGYSYNNATGSNEYGKDGMAVTSDDWTDFKATITFPEDWNEASTDTAVGQKIFVGVGKKSDINAAVFVDMTLGDSIYFAEEVPYDISVTGEKLSLNCKETINLSGRVVNQIGLPGKLPQNIFWYAVNADRTEIAEDITITEGEEGTATVSVAEDTAYGKYYVIAESEDYEGFKKGVEITVKKPLLDDYVPGSGSGAENHIQKPENSGFASASSGDVTYTAGDGYVTIEAKNDISSELGVEGLKVRTVGANGLPSSFNFDPGKTYLIKVRVRNPQPETETFFNASISNGTEDTLALTGEFGSEGMLLTEDWQDFNASIKVSENYDGDAVANKRVLLLGFNTGTQSGAMADIELSVSVGDVTAYNILIYADEGIVLGCSCFLCPADNIDLCRDRINAVCDVIVTGEINSPLVSGR